MTNELNTKIAESIEVLGKDWSNREMGNMPITKGQVLTFIDGEAGVEVVETTINGAKTKYGVFKTAEGFNVPFTQIARNNNGLGLAAKTRKEAIEEFAGRIDGNYSVKVADVKKVESSFGEGKMTYLVFEAQV